MKRKFVVVVTGVVLILAIFALAPLFRIPRSFEEVVQKYPKGTLARKALDDFKGRVEIKHTGNVPFEPREDERRTYVFYYIRVPWADAEMEFNYYQELVRIQRISELKIPD